MSSILRNTVWLSVAEVINKGLVFLVTVLIARSLGVEAYGIFGFVFAFITLLGIVADFGMSTAVIRDVAHHPESTETRIQAGLSVKVILSLAAAGLAIALVQLLGKPLAVERLVYLASLFLVVNALTAYLHAVFRAREQMKYEAISRIVQYAVLLIATVIGIVWQVGLTGFVMAYVISAVGGLLTAGWFVVNRFMPVRLVYDWPMWKTIIRQSAPLAVTAAFFSIYYNIDQVMLSVMRTDVEVGLYNAAYKLVTLMLGINVMLLNPGFPVIARLIKQPGDELRRLINRYTRLMAMIAIPVAVGGLLLARPIMALLFGPDYADGARALQILLWSVVFLFMSAVFSRILIAAYKQQVHLWSVVSGSVINVAINFFLIPRFGLVGAAAATLLTEVIIFALTYWNVQRITNISLIRAVGKPLVAAGVMVGLLRLVPTAWPVWISLGIGIVLYGLTMVLIRGLALSELKHLWPSRSIKA